MHPAMLIEPDRDVIERAREACAPVLGPASEVVEIVLRVPANGLHSAFVECASVRFAGPSGLADVMVLAMARMAAPQATLTDAVAATIDDEGDEACAPAGAAAEAAS